MLRRSLLISFAIGALLASELGAAPAADALTLPQTSLTTGPHGTTIDTTPTFSFDSSVPGSTFECRVDWGAWTACVSPSTTSALVNGAHLFRVRAMDGAANVDATPAVEPFHVLASPGSIVAWGAQYSPLGHDYVAIAASMYYSHALRSDGSIFCWSWAGPYCPELPAGSDFVAIAAGTDFGAALKNDGSIVAWGDNTHGQATPPAGSDYVAFTAGFFHGLALKNDGTIVGWGANGFGQANSPGGDDYVAIAAGSYYSLALHSDGSIVGWGENYKGQASPPAGNDYVAIAAGLNLPNEDGHSLALKNDGSIVGWGANPYGEANPPTGNDYVAIAAGYDTSVGLNADGTVAAWGYNDSGQGIPPPGNKYVAVASGGWHGLALSSDTTPPTDPVLASPSHTVGQPSNDTTVAIIWSGAADPGSGVDGFSFVWDQIASTVPDTAKDAEQSATGTTSDVLAEGSWYFHLRTRDNTGHWTSTAHIGPFVIDTTAPYTGYAEVDQLLGGQVSSGPIEIYWQANDNLTPTADLQHEWQYRKFVRGKWRAWTAGGTTDELELVRTQPFGKAYQYRIRTRDLAGNWGIWETTDSVKLLARQETSFTFSANWNRHTMAGAWGGYVCTRAKVGAWARLSFTGNGVALVMPAGAGQGTINVCLDPGTAGQQCRTLNLATFTPAGVRRLVTVFDGLSAGSHVLRLTIVSGTVNLDGAIVRQ